MRFYEERHSVCAHVSACAHAYLDIYIFFPDRSMESEKLGDGPEFRAGNPADEEGDLTYLLYDHGS